MSSFGVGTRNFSRDNGTAFGGVLNAEPTGMFFASAGARVHRVNDRLFLGAAVLNDGTTLGGGAGADWFSAGTGVSAGMAWVHFAAIVALTVPSGRVGFAAASRASDVPVGYGSRQTSIPFVGIAIMDRGGGGPPYWTSYGGYFEGRIEPISANTGTVIGIEIDAINFGSAAGPSQPSRLQTLGGATALWLAGGGDPANHRRAVAPAQLAIGIVDNGAGFETGIAFAATALAGTDGTTGFAPAIRMATRQFIDWWTPGGSPSFGVQTTFITSTATIAVASLQFQNGATLLVTPAGKISFAVGNVSNAVNSIGIIPAILGAAPILESFGDNIIVDLAVKPKGGGALNLFAATLFWYSAAGNQLAYVQTSVVTAANINGLEFADGGPFFYGRGGVIASFTQVNNPVSNLSFSNAASGIALSITAQGAGDIDILLDPGGSNGTIRLAVPRDTSASVGSASALPGVPAGYYRFKTEAGTITKIPFWND